MSATAERRSFDRHVVIVGNDCTAFFFSDSLADEPVEKPSAMLARIIAEAKSFLPKVSRVSPVQAKLASGRTLQIIAPHTLLQRT
jgi:hypothetical protein